MPYIGSANEMKKGGLWIHQTRKISSNSWSECHHEIYYISSICKEYQPNVMDN